jgi:hypothetical protein
MVNWKSQLQHPTHCYTPGINETPIAGALCVDAYENKVIVGGRKSGSFYDTVGFIQISTDSGRTFDAPVFFTNYYVTCVKFITADIVLAGVNRHGWATYGDAGIWRSTNGGVTWVHVWTQPNYQTDPRAFVISPNGDIYGAMGEYVYKSIDVGVTWVWSIGPFNINVGSGLVAMALAAVGSNVVVTTQAVQACVMWCTANGGTTWDYYDYWAALSGVLFAHNITIPMIVDLGGGVSLTTMGYKANGFGYTCLKSTNDGYADPVDPLYPYPYGVVQWMGDEVPPVLHTTSGPDGGSETTTAIFSISGVAVVVTTSGLTYTSSDGGRTWITANLIVVLPGVSVQPWSDWRMVQAACCSTPIGFYVVGSDSVLRYYQLF